MPGTSIKDYYGILGLPKGATAKDIKSAYYDKAKAYHPDANQQGNADSLKFQQVSEAYEVLSDESKRRAYDSTYRSQTPRRQSNQPFEPQKQRQRGQPINMNHIQHVYRTLNRNKTEEEVPLYRPFEDHNYPGTNFNRFEYSRQWNPYSNSWAYLKKSTVGDYHKQMREKSKILNICVLVMMLGSMAYVLNYKYFFGSSFAPKYKTEKDIEQDRVHER